MKMNGSDTRFKTRLAALASFVAAEKLSWICFFFVFAGFQSTGAASAAVGGVGQFSSVLFCERNLFDIIRLTVEVTSSTLFRCYVFLLKRGTTFLLKQHARITDQEVVPRRHGPVARCQSWISLPHMCTSHPVNLLVLQLRQNDAQQTESF